MKTLTGEINIEPYKSKAFDIYFKGKSFAVFDIETTGLSPSGSKIILSGLLTVKGDICQVSQFFASDYNDEKEIVEKTVEIINSVDFIVTYNGRQFDIPFLKKRAAKHDVDFNDSVYNLDLYSVVRTSSPLRKMLPDLKQKSLEAFMGTADLRRDEISGGESIKLYNRYMQHPSLDLEKKILLHNHDDVVQLYKLLNVISKIDFHKAMYINGFPAGNYTVRSIDVGRWEMSVTADQNIKEPINYMSFSTDEMPYTLMMNAADKKVELVFPCENEADASYFDIAPIFSDSEAFMKYPSVQNGYIITVNSGQINYLEINSFLIRFFSSLNI